MNLYNKIFLLPVDYIAIYSTRDEKLWQQSIRAPARVDEGLMLWDDKD
jgi:hypothetical protein